MYIVLLCPNPQESNLLQSLAQKMRIKAVVVRTPEDALKKLSSYKGPGLFMCEGAAVEGEPPWVGVNVMREVSEKFPTLKIFAMCPHDDAETLRVCQELGVEHIFQRPISVPTYYSKLEMFLKAMG